MPHSPSLLAAAAAAVIASALPAAARTLNVELVGITNAGPGETYADNVDVTAAPAPVVAEPGYAGGLEISIDGDAVTDFVAWCLDLPGPITFGQFYEYRTTETPFSNSFLDAIGADRVQRVFDANIGAVDPSRNVDAIAFQFALWEVVYDTDFDLTTGAFQGVGLGPDAAAVDAAAAGYLAAAAAYAGPAVSTLTFLQSQEEPRSQNIVTAEAVAPVPLPAAGALLAAALGGLAWRGRRAGA